MIINKDALLLEKFPHYEIGNIFYSSYYSKIKFEFLRFHIPIVYFIIWEFII